MRYDAAGELALISELTDPDLVVNPYQWLRTAIRWGEVGTELAEIKDMRHWQRDLFEDMGDQLRANVQRIRVGEEPKVIRIAVRSGHGSGKSAWFAMARHYYQSAWLCST